MKRKIPCNQKLDSSMCLELSDREAEALQGGAIKPLGGTIIPHLPLVNTLVLLFANPFSA